jgi:DNA-binding LytR/AlgR family response regulator
VSTLLVEDSPSRIEWFRERLPNLAIATEPGAAVRLITAMEFRTVFLDFDLGSANSLGVAHLLADAPPDLCVIHSANERGAKLLKEVLPDALVLPFASFEIENGSLIPDFRRHGSRHLHGNLVHALELSR